VHTPFRSLLLALILVAVSMPGALAQSQSQTYWWNGTTWVPAGSSFPFPIAGTFSDSIGGFHPTTVGTPVVATTGGATGSLPGGTTVVATNTGATYGAYCALGGSSSTSQQYIAPNGGWFGFTISGETQITCLTTTGTTTVNLVGGTGLPTGTGGGGGGGSGGAPVTPTNVGGSTYIGGNAVTLITAGACAHQCDLDDSGQAGGFWIDTTGVAPVPGVSEFIPAGGHWYSPVGLTTAIEVIPLNTGVLTGTVQ
jgi:hypothetical protein